MLVLLMRAAGQLFCIRATAVIEVIPRVPLQPVPQAPGALAGLLRYRSEVIPVVDLRTLVEGEPSEPFLSTRIAVVEGPSASLSAGPKRFGLIAERATETLAIDEHELAPAPVSFATAPWLGSVFVHEGAVVRELIPGAFRIEEAVA